MKARHKRFGLIAVGLILLVITTVLITKSFQSNLVFFFTPTQVEKGEAPKSGSFRIGGLVENGSLKRLPDGLHVQFRVTDTAKTMQVMYKGILPDLFKEGKGVVAQGKLVQTDCLRPTKYWPNMMKIICRQKPQRHLRPLKKIKQKVK